MLFVQEIVSEMLVEFCSNNLLDCQLLLIIRQSNQHINAIPAHVRMFQHGLVI